MLGTRRVESLIHAKYQRHRRPSPVMLCRQSPNSTRTGTPQEISLEVQGKPIPWREAKSIFAAKHIAPRRDVFCCNETRSPLPVGKGVGGWVLASIPCITIATTALLFARQAVNSEP